MRRCRAGRAGPFAPRLIPRARPHQQLGEMIISLEADGNVAGSANVYPMCRFRPGAGTRSADSSEERVMDTLVTTTRLTLRGWSADDAPAALAIYGSAQVARWLTPAMARIADIEAMRS